MPVPADSRGAGPHRWPARWLQPVATVTRLIRWDLRRFRGLALFVAGLEVARGVAIEAALQLPMEPGRVDEGAGWLRMFGPLLTFGLNAVATAIVVQADHPADDRAFWRTRPIRPATAAMAKIATLVVLLVAVPAAVASARLAWSGAPLPAMLAASVQIGVVAGATVVPAWALALLSRTLPRFLALSLGVVVAYVFVVGQFAGMTDAGRSLVEQVHPSGGRTRDWQSFVWLWDWQREDRHGWSGAAIASLVGISIVVGYYATRRAALAGLAGLALLVAPNLWPERGDVTTLPPSALREAIEGRVILPFELSLPSREARRGWPHGDPFWIYGAVWLPPLPRDVTASVDIGATRLRTSRGSVDAVGTPRCCFGLGPRGVLQQTLPVPTSPQRWQSRGLFRISPGDLDTLRAPRVAVEAELTVRLARHAFISSLPLRPGSTLQTDRYRIDVIEGPPPRGLILRLALFPVLAKAHDCHLWLVRAEGRPTVAEGQRFQFLAPEVWGPDAHYGLFPLLPCSTWDGGRSWTVRLATFGSGSETLAVLESRPIGVVRTKLEVRDMPVAPVD